MRELNLNKQMLNELMKSLSQTFEGVKTAKKILKRNEKIDTTQAAPVTDEFWADLRSYAKTVGINVIRFTAMDENFIFEEEMIGYHVKDGVLDNAIVLGMEMKKDAINQAPEPTAGNESMRVYAELGNATNKLATYIQEHGFQAQAFHPFGGPILYPPMAEKAGMGEVGINGLLITREFGPRLRLSIVTINAAPLPHLESVSFGIRAFCRTCGLCVKKCPTQAILPYDQKVKSINGKYIRNIESEKCFPQFFKTHGCSICIKVCPFSQVGYEKVIAKIGPKMK
ncbi:MAG TPA: 4Fe-4S double cluster binding domain-containing protein [Candidatus Deferrimicrobium sp.]|nr:4Fe-4S double cluster binding domain-containing protein [Candidatus Deferrimicrobium sp.]